MWPCWLSCCFGMRLSCRDNVLLGLISGDLTLLRTYLPKPWEKMAPQCNRDCNRGFKAFSFTSRTHPTKTPSYFLLYSTNKAQENTRDKASNSIRCGELKPLKLYLHSLPRTCRGVVMATLCLHKDSLHSFSCVTALPVWLCNTNWKVVPAQNPQLHKLCAFNFK